MKSPLVILWQIFQVVVQYKDKVCIFLSKMMKFTILLIFSECNFSESLKTEKPTNTGVFSWSFVISQLLAEQRHSFMENCLKLWLRPGVVQ